jgi:carbonic anhydrase
MDPVTLILSALASGAVVAAKDTANQVVKDAYQGLKALIQRKFAGKPDAESALAKYERKPEVYKEPLKDELSQVVADKDEEIIKAAQKLMSLIDPQQAAKGKYNVQIAGNVYGLAQGDHQQVTMNFGGKQPEE